MNHLAKPLVMGLTAICATTGVLYAALTISTDPATHDAFLHTLSLGDKDNQTQILQLQPETQNRLIIPENLIAGDDGNTIDSSATFSVIGGGTANSIGANVENATIGAGDSNKVSASNAAIGAGRLNTIDENAV